MRQDSLDLYTEVHIPCSLAVELLRKPGASSSLFRQHQFH